MWATARTSFYSEELCSEVAAAASAAAAAAAAATSAAAAAAAQQPGPDGPQLWGAHDLSTVAWALGSHRHYDSRHLNSLAAHVESHLASYQWTDLCRVAYAFAVLHHHNPQLLATIARAAVERQALMDRQGACLLPWSLATLGHVHLPLFRACYRCGSCLWPTVLPRWMPHAELGCASGRSAPAPSALAPACPPCCRYYEDLFSEQGRLLAPEDGWAPQLFHADMMARLLVEQRQQQRQQPDVQQQGGGQAGEQLPELSSDLRHACFQAWRRRLGKLHISDAQQQVAQVRAACCRHRRRPAPGHACCVTAS